jgi:uncharacterized protein (TIGR00661 family)
MEWSNSLMKKINILYGVQCTGNGHLTRSKEIINYLNNNYNVNIDVCLSGNFSQVDTSDLNVKYKFKGLGFTMENGRISLFKSWKHLDFKNFFSSLFKINVKKYDIIVSDFEPITCWSALLRRKKVLGVGNHYKFISNKKFIKNLSPYYFSNKMISKMICPVNNYIAFDYIKENDNDFFPIIKTNLKRIHLSDDNHYVVYLNSFSLDEQIKFFNLFQNEKFYIFNSEVKESYDYENLKLRKIDKLNFTEKLLRSKGVICHTGFQTTSECLYLGKKMLVIPIKNQIEQIYNTKTLKKLGVISAENLDIKKFNDFFINDYSVKLNYTNEFKQICDIITNFRS